MERPKLRPTVTITTYSTPSLGAPKEPEASKSEFSTDFFEKFRSQARGLAPSASGKPRVLMDLSQIKGPSGSVRGHKDVVRKSLESIKVAHSRRLNFSSGTFLCASRQSSNANSLLSSGCFQSIQASNQHDSRYSIVTSSSMVTSNTTNLQRNSLASLQSNLAQLYQGEFLERLCEEELGQCVAYTTSLGVIRRTFEDSKLIK